MKHLTHNSHGLFLSTQCGNNYIVSTDLANQIFEGWKLQKVSDELSLICTYLSDRLFALSISASVIIWMWEIHGWRILNICAKCLNGWGIIMRCLLFACDLPTYKLAISFHIAAEKIWALFIMQVYRNFN